VSHWQLQPLQLWPVILVGVAYLMRTRALAAKGRPVRTARRVAFYSGLTLAVVALVSPLDYLAENRLFWAHMAQHLLLGDIAPLLVVLGLTGSILRPLLAIGWVRRLRGLAHPLVALPLWFVNLYLWHLAPLYQAALHHDDVHALQHFLFFTCGALMWAAVIEPIPGPQWFGNGWKAVYTLVVRVAGMVLANVFIWASHPLYSYYVWREHLAHISPLTDQKIAGLIMFIEGAVITMVAFGWLFIRFTKELEIRQRLVERDLDHTLAARAARYGRSARVRDVT
jgi:putative membrane protein